MKKPLVLALVATVVFACEGDYLIWIPRSKSADPLYRFVKGGKAGYIDGKGRVVIPPALETYGNHGSEFHNGLLIDSGRYVDQAGKIVKYDGFIAAADFSEGLAVANRKGEHLSGYINTSGEFVISPRFETYPNGSASSFSEGLAMIDVKGRIGYIDHSGEFVINPKFLDGTDFSDGMARVVTDGPCFYFPEGPCGLFNPRSVGRAGDGGACKFTFIDKTGRVITEQRFDYARDFSEGLAPVRIGELWGFIDKAGKIVIPPTFEDADPFSSGLARILGDDGFGYIDKSGNIVVAPQFGDAEDFSEGLAVVGDYGQDHYWYIDRRGRQTIGEEFEAASPFFKGLAHVDLISKDGLERHAYIDRTGRHIFTY